MLLLITFVVGGFLIRRELPEVGWPWVIVAIGIGLVEILDAARRSAMSGRTQRLEK